MKKLLFLLAILPSIVSAQWFNVVFYNDVYGTKINDLSFYVKPERCQELLIKYSQRRKGPYWISCSVKPLPNAIIIRTTREGDL